MGQCEPWQIYLRCLDTSVDQRHCKKTPFEPPSRRSVSLQKNLQHRSSWSKDAKRRYLRSPILEDSVVEHDARRVPGYELTGSDFTGRAVFERGTEKLEVFTANKKTLEQVFGVDLIYVNVTKSSVVMLQYKMLEPVDGDGDGVDWVYRPDKTLGREIARMKKFTVSLAPSSNEYRINSTMFYIKFIKRDASIRNGSVITPLDHFEVIRADPSFRGPRDGVQISYAEALGTVLAWSLPSWTWFDQATSGPSRRRQLTCEI